MSHCHRIVSSFFQYFCYTMARERKGGYPHGRTRNAIHCPGGRIPVPRPLQQIGLVRPNPSDQERPDIRSWAGGGGGPGGVCHCLVQMGGPVRQSQSRRLAVQHGKQRGPKHDPRRPAVGCPPAPGPGRAVPPALPAPAGGRPGIGRFGLPRRAGAAETAVFGRDDL